MPKSLCATLLVLIFACGSAVSATTYVRLDANSPIVLAANGCGPGFFRTLAGECFPNRRIVVGPRRGVVLPPPCPRGFLRDPDPARPLCYPVF